MNEADDRAVQRILEKGLCTREQVDEALHIRDTMVAMGLRARPLTEILFEKGSLEREQLEELRREDRRFQGQEQIAGYRLLELLGEGAMGSVYKARQLSLDRDVAIKVLAGDLARDAAYVQRFQQEARTVARLSHTNLVSGIDVGEADGIHYLVMEYADGNTVGSLLRRGGALDEERSLVIAQQIARALDHAHKNGLVHRDVKPENVIVTREGVAKLCDLGLARLNSGASASGGEPGQKAGTPDYISPEQARGEVAVDGRSDLYSLGATLYHMLAGRPPFEAPTAAAVLARHLTEPVVPLNALGADVDPRTELLVTRLLAKSPAERFANASELLGALDAIVRDLQQERGRSAALAAPSPQGTSSSKPAAPVARRRGPR